MDEESILRCVVIGDSGVGKTTLVSAYSGKQFPARWDPASLAEEYTFTLLIGGLPRIVQLRDVTGLEYDDQRRKEKLYPIILESPPDVFLICFSVVSPTSLQNLKTKWLPEIKTCFPKIPYLLIGTQTDLRNDVITLARNWIDPITTEDGEILAEELHAVKYTECSAVQRTGVSHVFNMGVLAAEDFSPRFQRKKERKCIIV